MKVAVVFYFSSLPPFFFIVLDAHDVNEEQAEQGFHDGVSLSFSFLLLSFFVSFFLFFSFLFL